MLVDGQPAGGSGAVPFPQVLSLLSLSVQVGLAVLKKKAQRPHQHLYATVSLGGCVVPCL